MLKILNQYILAELVVLHINHAPLCLQCQPRRKLDLTSAEVLLQLMMSAGGRQGQAYAHAMGAKQQSLN
jgi:hypothetical protein